MKRLLLPLALAAALTVPVGAQFGWFQLNGGLIARLSSSETAATIRQDGSGAILDLYAGATRVWRATSTGITNSVAALFADGTAAAPSMAFANESSTGFRRINTSVVGWPIGGTDKMILAPTALGLAGTAVFGWTAGADANDTRDLILARDAANTLAQRNGTAAQAFRVYGTYTDAANYERLSIGYDTGNTRYFISPSGAGTGTARNLLVGNWIYESSTGNLLASSDNSYDIGSAANAVKDVYLDGRVNYGGVTFAALGTPANGQTVYCTDCTPNVSPCTGAGTGAIAKRLNAAWDCR